MEQNDFLIGYWCDRDAVAWLATLDRMATEDTNPNRRAIYGREADALRADLLAGAENTARGIMHPV